MSSSAQADNAFLRDVLGLSSVDAGEGFLIFGLPPAELAMHEAEPGGGGKHELYLICDDVQAFVDKMTGESIPVEEVADRGWGLTTGITLPSGLRLGVYEARHARPAAKKKAGKALLEVAKAVRQVSKKAAKRAKKAVKKADKAAKRADQTPRQVA